MARTERILLIVLIGAYLIVGALFAARTAAWQAPDEPAHYNYVAQVAGKGCCPVLETGDWDSAYLDDLKAARFPADRLGDLATIQYEDHQPPLYYLLASVVYRVTDASLLALRLLSVVIGAGVVLGAYAVGRALLPDAPQIALGTAALVAFVPQHVAMLAAVNNDGLAEVLVAAALWLTVVYLKTARVRAWQLGIVVGLGLLTKVSTIFLAGLVPLAILAKWWINAHPLPATSGRLPPLISGEGAYTPVGNARAERRTQSLRSSQVPLSPQSSEEMDEFVPLPEVGEGKLTEANQRLAANRRFARSAGVGSLLRPLLAFALPMLILGGVWWARNLSVYGFPDLFGLARHNVVVADQPRTADLIAQVGAGEYLRRGVEVTFNSFWGQFGWMALPLQAWMYALILALLIAAAAGWVIQFWAQHAAPLQAPTDARQRAAWGIVIAAGLLALAQYVYYNTEFLQLQGRYLYPGLVPFGLAVALGVDGWQRAIFGGDGKDGRTAVRPYITAVVLAVVLVALDLYIVWRVLPGLAP